MAALQGYITNSHNKQQGTVAHDQMTAMIRTWDGGIKITVDRTGLVRIYAGPHDHPGRHQIGMCHLGDHPDLIPIPDPGGAG